MYAAADSAAFPGSSLRWQLVPVWQGEPAGGDHLRQVEFILGPEFGIGRQEALASGVELDQPDSAGQGQPQRG